MAAAKALLVMVGGDDGVVNRCRPVLNTFANPLVHLGGLGAGQAAKLLNNALFSAHLGLAASAFSVADALGVDKDALAGVLSKGSGRSYAAEVIAGSGHSISVIAQLAGPLLAKDVDILADLVGRGSAEVLNVARNAVNAMNLNNQVITHAQ
jgi:3-hydroxyisobutyrate dehydrogenase-like beta-hydroxyacid dehydrogenase